MNTKEQLIEKFERRSATVAVIGLGYVGLPLCIAFAKAGYQVIGIDLDKRKVDSINRGESYIEDIPTDVLARYTNPERLYTNGSGKVADAAAALDAPVLDAPVLDAATDVTVGPLRTAAPGIIRGSLRATSDYSVLSECDAVSICVPTPLNKTGDPNLAYIVSSSEQIAEYLHPGMAIVLESTTYPGTTTEIMLPRLTGASGQLEVGKDFFLAFSPERIDPGREDWTVETMPKVMGGVTPNCLAVASAFYGAFVNEIVQVSSPEAAEMVKLFENTFRAVNIGLANELLLMCDKLGLDAWEVLDAAATKPFGFMKFTPGPGLGGHCIPVDPHYLSWKLRSLQYNARFIELASEINTSMPLYWVQKVQDQLNDVGKAVKGSKILVLGVAYKKDVGDLRESPALDIIHLLEEKGAQVDYHDPYVPSFVHDGMEMVSLTDLEAGLKAADCVVVATDHSDYVWAYIVDEAKVLVDTRHICAI